MRIKSLLQTHDPDFVKGLFAGIAGGLLASLLMEQFQALWNKAAVELNPTKDEETSSAPEESSTIKVAQAISERFTHKRIPADKKVVASETVHYAMGATSGAIYGVTAELIPLATVAEGLVFGASVWLVADEAIVPALGLGKSAKQTPVSTHIYALTSHLVYGFVTETVRRAMRGVL